MFYRNAILAVSGISFFLTTNVQAQYVNEPIKCDDGFWGDANYLYWKIQDSPKTIPFVVEGPVAINGSPVLEEPDTKIILGNKKIDESWRSGSRFTVGYWFDDQHCLGFETNYFFLPNASKTESATSSGVPESPFFTVPYFDVITNLESSNALALPGSFAGTATLKISNSMQGVELNIVTTQGNSYGIKVDVLGGFRYWNFVENLSFNTNSPYIPPNPSDTFFTNDKFQVQNNFYGVQAGSKLDCSFEDFFFNIKAKIALGAMYQKSRINGQLVTNDFNEFGSTVTYPGGIFALPTNIGNHKATRFSVIPEVNINLGFQVMESFSVQVGYTFLYATNVLRASKQVNRNINPTQSSTIEYTPSPSLTGKASPKGTLKSEGIWAQGFNVGVEMLF